MNMPDFAEKLNRDMTAAQMGGQKEETPLPEVSSHQDKSSTDQTKSKMFYVDGDRFYVVDGEKYPSVTTILSCIRMPRLEIWRGDKGNEEADRLRDVAADLGTRVHAACELINRGQGPALIGNEIEDALVRLYREWFETCVSQVYEVEPLVYSKSRRFAGRPDLMAILNGDVCRTIVDVKTSGYADKPKWQLQTGGYLGAHSEMHQNCEPFLRRLIVHLDKSSLTLKTYEFTEHARDYNRFLYAKEIYHHMRGD